MKCSILYNTFSVPTTPDNFIVCPVYDKVNGTLQITETTWNELVCWDCHLLVPYIRTVKKRKKIPGGLVIFFFLSGETGK